MENQEQFRDLKFEVAYSYCYEKIMYKFFGRLDKLASFILLLTGMSVVATAWSGLALGSIVAIVTSLQLIYTPGQRSQAAKDACRAYLSLYQSLNTMTAEQIRESLLSLNQHLRGFPSYRNPPRKVLKQAEILLHLASHCQSFLACWTQYMPA